MNVCVAVVFASKLTAIIVLDIMLRYTNTH